MSSIHPFLHTKLVNFSIFYSFEELISSEEKAISFDDEIGLIPSRQSTAPICCGLPMQVEEFSLLKLKWVWRCSSKGSKKKGSTSCRKIVNPSSGTFFEGATCHIKVRDVLAIVFCFVIDMQITVAYKHLLAWRHHRDDSELSWSTMIDYYSYCHEIAEVKASRSDLVLGGKGKTVQIDKTFLTKRKYNRGCITEQMTTTVLGLYCKECKIGLFFKVNYKSKKELLPYIQKYVDFNTSGLCTDSAKQYHRVEQMFSSDTVHLQTNHSIGEYVHKSNPANTINDLENQNKLLKRSIKCRRSAKLLYQYMVLYFYRKYYLKEYENDFGSQIMQILLDIKLVYPGVVDGELKESLTIKELDPPVFSSDEENKFLPPSKKPRIDEEADNDLDDIERAIEEDLSDPDYETDIF